MLQKTQKKQQGPQKEDIKQGANKPTLETEKARHDLPSTSQFGVERRRGTSTRVVVKLDVGFGNQIFIRGKGANLSWDKGILLKNTKPDEWVWETDAPFSACEFKILINDNDYESGENHPLTCGSNIQYSPKFG